MSFPIQANLDALNIAIPSSPTINSINGILRRAAGYLASKVITLDASGTTQNLNCFQITGQVKCFALYGVVTTAATFTNCTAANFQLYDSTAPVDLTKNDGVLSGMAVGTLFGKTTTAATTMSIANNAAGALIEANWDPFVVNQKTGANTYLRFTYTTTDAPIAATMTIYCEYYPIGSSTLTAV
jgi:hypothetical protein